MNRVELSKKLRTDEQFVLEELQKLRTFYALKHEIRYGMDREEEIDTESVAEHIYGMFVLSRYFIPLEDPECDWDVRKIDDMIMYHDIDEIETGDTIGYLRTSEHQSVEIEPADRVIEVTPQVQHELIRNVIAEYFAQETVEAKFVRAIDKFEPVVHLYCQSGKETLLYNKTTFEQGMSIKRPVMKEFPYLLRFTEVASERMLQEGFFTQELSLGGQTSK